MISVSGCTPFAVDFEALLRYFEQNICDHNHSFVITALKRKRARTMKNSHFYFAYCLIVLGLILGCQRKESAPISSFGVETITAPVKANSGQSDLFSAQDGQVYLSWLEPADEDRIVFQFSILEGDRWSEPKTIATGENWIVYWADLPSIRMLSDGTLAAHWIGQAKHLYDVNVSYSSDGGETWTTPVSPHQDGTDTEHGFASLAPWKEDRIMAVWLDGRNHDATYLGPGKGDTALRIANISPAGQISDETVLDPRVCDCCPTSAALTTSGPIIVYRDRSEIEGRDISIVRFDNGSWTEPSLVHADGWEINGCPVNGPAVSAAGDQLAVAWFTGANDQALVRVSLSKDGGKTLGQPIRVDGGSPLGNVEVLMLDSGEAVVAWMEQADDGADFRVRRVRVDGSLGDSHKVNHSGHATGMPRMALSGGEIVFAWTSAGDEKQIVTGRAKLSDL